MAFLKCRSLRSERLVVAGRPFSVDVNGLVEVPDDLALQLAEAIPGEYQLAEGEPERRTGRTNEEYRQLVAELEHALQQGRDDLRRVVEKAKVDADASAFQLADRDGKLTAAQERIAEIEQQLEEVPVLRRTLAAAQEQVQTLLRQVTAATRGDEKPNSETPDSSGKGKRR